MATTTDPNLLSATPTDTGATAAPTPVDTSASNTTSFTPAFGTSSAGSSTTNTSGTTAASSPSTSATDASQTTPTTIGKPDVAQTTAVTGQVDPTKGTVQGQLGTLLASDSPYLQAAGAQASQAANDRGLINSTMGVQAGQAAAINAAMPIATADAASQNQQALSNQQAQNSTNQFNTTAQNTGNLAGFQENSQLANISAQGDVNKQIQTLQNQSAQAIDMLDNTYKQILQTEVSAQQAYQNGQQAINAIITTPNLNADEKRAFINREVQFMNGGLAVIDATNKGTLNTNLANLLNFDTTNL